MQLTNIETMGRELGETYTELWQELVRLNLKNTEYETLFSSEKMHIDLLNRTSPRLFRIIQNSLWNDILLGVCRISDKTSTSGNANLTVLSLAELNKQTDIEIELKKIGRAHV